MPRFARSSKVISVPRETEEKKKEPEKDDLASQKRKITQQIIKLRNELKELMRK